MEPRGARPSLKTKDKVERRHKFTYLVWADGNQETRKCRWPTSAEYKGTCEVDRLTDTWRMSKECSDPKPHPGRSCLRKTSRYHESVSQAHGDFFHHPTTPTPIKNGLFILVHISICLNIFVYIWIRSGVLIHHEHLLSFDSICAIPIQIPCCFACNGFVTALRKVLMPHTM